MPAGIPLPIFALHPGGIMSQVASPGSIAAGLADYWSPRVVCELDDSYLKVAKVLGTFGWHAHDNEDELFFILKGQLRIEMEGSFVELSEGDTFVVPKGARHNPIAAEECHIMLIERKTTLHTGSVVNDKTRSISEQLGPS
ncbi:MAG: cupin domain-containing protein [Arenimonas sp.]